MSEHRHYGNRIVQFWETGETRLVAHCDKAAEACKLLDRARVLNDQKRRYTEAARTIARAESLPGFAWVD